MSHSKLLDSVRDYVTFFFCGSGREGRIIFTLGALTYTAFRCTRWYAKKLIKREKRKLIKNRSVNIGAIFGMDVGGTLAKIVYFEKDDIISRDTSSSSSAPEWSRESTATSPDMTPLPTGGEPSPAPLPGDVPADILSSAGGSSSGAGDANSLRTASGAVAPSIPPPLPALKRSVSFSRLDNPDHQDALARIYSFIGSQVENPGTTMRRDDVLCFSSPLLGGKFHFLHFETRNMANAIGLLGETSVTADIHTIGCTGGGAHKYAKEFTEQLGITVELQDELASLIKGMFFVMATVPGECYAYRKEPQRLRAGSNSGGGGGDTTSNGESLHRNEGAASKRRASSGQIRQGDGSASAADKGRAGMLLNAGDEDALSAVDMAAAPSPRRARGMSESVISGAGSGSGLGAKVLVSMPLASSFASNDARGGAAIGAFPDTLSMHGSGISNMSDSGSAHVGRRIRSRTSSYNCPGSAVSSHGDAPSVSGDLLTAGGSVNFLPSRSRTTSLDEGKYSTTPFSVGASLSTTPTKDGRGLLDSQDGAATSSSSAPTVSFDLHQHEDDLSSSSPPSVVTSSKSATSASAHGKEGASISGVSEAATSSASFCPPRQKHSANDYVHIVELPSDVTSTSFPYLVVNIGSGVSILKVNSTSSFERVSGSSIGGGTFWGLCRLFTGAASYQEALDLTEIGDSTAVDMLVRDIYGGGYDAMNLSGSMVASSFGRLCMKEVGDVRNSTSGGTPTNGGDNGSNSGGGNGRLAGDGAGSGEGKRPGSPSGGSASGSRTSVRQNESDGNLSAHSETDGVVSGRGGEVFDADIAQALLLMITNNIGQVAYLNAQLHKCTKICFIGNFLRQNQISCRRLAFAIDFWSGGAMEATFFKHEGYFGALGTLLSSAFGKSLDDLLESLQQEQRRINSSTRKSRNKKGDYSKFVSKSPVKSAAGGSNRFNDENSSASRDSSDADQNGAALFRSPSV